MPVPSDLLVCLRFFSRFQLPAATAREAVPGAFAEAAAMTSVAGAIIGLVPAGMLLAMTAVGLPPLLSSPLAIAALVIATGALHEDGLADCADGFGVGATRERKLEIMRDSRIGTYGACAIVLSLYLRAFALGTIATRSIWLGAAVVVCAAALSRAMCLLPLMLLPPARVDGLGASAGKPASLGFGLALGLALATAGPAITLGAPFRDLMAVVLWSLASTLGMTWLAWRQIGGQTGDVIGAAQQVAELAVLMAFAGSIN